MIIQVKATCGGGSKGGASPLRPKIFSISCSFREILTKSYVGTPPRGSAPPPTGNPGSAPGLHVHLSDRPDHVELFTVKNLIRVFHKRRKIGKNGIIANYVFPHICSFHLYLHHMLLVNMTLDISWYNRVTFQGCTLQWSSSFLMEQLKQSWQYWHSCIVKSLWKTLWSQHESTTRMVRTIQ